MSWDADLIDDRGHFEGQWGYTHNCNTMIAEALTALGARDAFDPFDDHPISKIIGPAWWKRLHGLSGPNGAAFLDELICALEADPEKYRAMNPENGWGDYDGLLKELTAMRDAVPEWPTTWSVHG